MEKLRPWQELPAGGTVRPNASMPHTGSWRTGIKPLLDLDKCTNCLLCWVYCPDAVIIVKEGAVVGIDDYFCKGCEVCAAVCPVGAIEMVSEETETPAGWVIRSTSDVSASDQKGKR
jgi:2-oxoacid:acceptor oxidoreductase delta subunit (pyruvate/2-ketoisovalerate family)